MTANKINLHLKSRFSFYIHLKDVTDNGFNETFQILRNTIDFKEA